MKSITALFICTLSLVASSSALADEPRVTSPPADKLPRVADGFEISVFASEPFLYKATSMCFDAAGRLMVGQGPQYHLSESIKETDSVVLLLDTDNDGVADQQKVFATGFNSIQGLAWKGRDLYVANSPELTVVRDLDGDDVADEYVVVYTDLGNHEHALHGLVWGPDGRLYMSKGNSKGHNQPEKYGRVAPKAFRELWDVEHPKGAPDIPPPKTFSAAEYKSTYHDPHDDWGRQGGVLRCDPLGGNLEIVSRGMRNPWDIAIDRGFNLIGTDNDQTQGDRIIMPFYGAHFGWGHHYSSHWTGEGNLPTVPVSGPMTSGSWAGIAYYDHPHFPASYRNAFFINDWLFGTYVYRPGWNGVLRTSADGSLEPFIQRREGGMLYRPTDLAVGPDGAIYTLGWGHNYHYEPGTDGTWIFRVTRRGDSLTRHVKASSQPLAKMTVAKLIDELGSHVVPARRVNAQDELVRRGGAIHGELAKAIADNKLTIVQQTWTVWTLGRAKQLDSAHSDLLAKWAIAALRQNPKTVSRNTIVPNVVQVGSQSGSTRFKSIRRSRPCPLSPTRDAEFRDSVVSGVRGPQKSALRKPPHSNPLPHNHASTDIDIARGGEGTIVRNVANQQRARISRNLRIQAIRILAFRARQFAELKPLANIVGRTLVDPDPRIRFETIQAIHQAALNKANRGKLPITPLIEQLSRETDRVASYAGWQALRDLASLEQRRTWLRHDSHRVRLAALLSLQEDYAVTQKDVLALVDRESDPIVQSWALTFAMNPTPPPKLSNKTLRIEMEQTVPIGQIIDRANKAERTNLRRLYLQMLSRASVREGGQQTQLLKFYRSLKSADERSLILPAAATTLAAFPDLWDALGGDESQRNAAVQGIANLHRLRIQQLNSRETKVRSTESSLSDVNRFAGEIADRLLSKLAEVGHKDVRVLGALRAIDALPLPKEWIVKQTQFAALLAILAQRPESAIQRLALRVLGRLHKASADKQRLGAVVQQLCQQPNARLYRDLQSVVAHFGLPVEVPKPKAATIEDVLARLKQADADRGRELFFDKVGGAGCVSCHRVRGRGSEVAPNLSGVGIRLKPDAIVKAIIDPSAAITEGYAMQLFQTEDGRTQTGAVIRETSSTVTLLRPDGTQVAIPQNTIESRKRLKQSVMPTGYALFGADQLADMTAWLMTLRDGVQSPAK